MYQPREVKSIIQYLKLNRNFNALLNHVLIGRPPESPSPPDRQQRRIFPFKHAPRMSLAPALERLEKPWDRFPEGIFLLPLLPTTQNTRHQSFAWCGRNRRVPFILTQSLFFFLQGIPFAASFMLPWVFCLLWDGGLCSQGLCSGCWEGAGDLPGSPSIHTHTHTYTSAPISETPNSRSQIGHLKQYL